MATAGCHARLPVSYLTVPTGRAQQTADNVHAHCYSGHRRVLLSERLRHTHSGRFTQTKPTPTRPQLLPGAHRPRRASTRWRRSSNACSSRRATSAGRSCRRRRAKEQQGWLTGRVQPGRAVSGASDLLYRLELACCIYSLSRVAPVQCSGPVWGQLARKCWKWGTFWVVGAAGGSAVIQSQTDSQTDSRTDSAPVGGALQKPAFTRGTQLVQGLWTRNNQTKVHR